MAATRTLDFLPEIFRTDTNQKFLSATLDQLVQEPQIKRINGYIGRQLTPTYKQGDNYIQELSLFRQNYQLEPTVIVKRDGKIEFASTYQDVLNKLAYYGAHVNNHSRLFENEYYTFDALVDYDKLVNFSQYYWLPSGPDPVDVFSSNIDLELDFDVTRGTIPVVHEGFDTVGYDTLSYEDSHQDTSNYQLGNQAYRFSHYADIENPMIVLARGGEYVFRVNQAGFPFWIQTEPGINGTKAAQSNISSRDVLGVSNNGASNGEVIFRVPEKTQQDTYLNMPTVATVSLATTLNYSDIQGALTSEFINKFGGIDGQRNLVGKKIIFLGNQPDENAWTPGGLFDENGSYYDSGDFDAGQTVPANRRYGVWQISNETGSDPILKLNFVQFVEFNEKVTILEGIVSGNKEYFKNAYGLFEIVPSITAIQDLLYYQDGNDPNLVGIIKLIDPTEASVIDVENDIIGKVVYTSPNGVEFTNGLKVRFDTDVIPAQYQQKEFYVEGVGTGIKLVDVSLLYTPEEFNTNLTEGFDTVLYDAGNYEASLDAPLAADYIVINRSSRDLNPWTRNNRWFHREVIELTAQYNNFTPVLNQKNRASRPIIEFDPDLQLFNSGRTGKRSVDVIDNKETDVFSNLEGFSGYYTDGVQLTTGMRIIFTNDTDPAVRNKIYTVRWIDPQGDGSQQMHFEKADDGDIFEGDNIVAVSGLTFKGVELHYNGNEWVRSQQKVSINQAPLFDVFDANGNSFSNIDYYNSTSFIGTKIFSYKEGTGRKDPVLGIPLAYRSFNNIGDIIFQNNLDNDTFTHIVSKLSETVNINSGHVRKNNVDGTVSPVNVWRTVNEPSKQYQSFLFFYDGQTTKFEIDILPESSITTPNIKVYVNNNIVDSTKYTIVYSMEHWYLSMLMPLNKSDKIDVQIYSNAPSNLGHYTIPLNLDNNSVNKQFTTLTLGQLRNHVGQCFTNTINIRGAFPGVSNLRDINPKINAGKILQHSAPVPYSELFLVSDTANFVKAVEVATKEYNRFRNKFLDLATNMDGLSEDPVVAVTQIMAAINAVKTEAFPYFYSDMVPCGELTNTIDYIVYDVDLKDYELSVIHNITAPSNKAVLVYLNGTQLVHGRDYVFHTDRPAITLTAAITLTYEDKLRLVEYSNTDGSWVPETPTKLGLYPKFTPSKQVDNTYDQTINVLIGHDGSITPAFEDYRDDIMLELEKRIYNNLKTSYDTSRFDFNEIIPGKFRQTDYTQQEVNQVLSKMFLKWTGVNRLNYAENENFAAGNPSSWNYGKFRDVITDSLMPGFWRGVFREFYDTDRPHTHPWEMLGFSEEPAWWKQRYGPGPYTAGNLVLWEDLEKGLVFAGPRRGIDEKYARPGLLRIIPVDENGNLRSPVEMLVKQFSSHAASGSFAIGDRGPVESAWVRSSEYPFALQILGALTKPAKYFGLLIDTVNNVTSNVNGQYLSSETNRRYTQNDVKINGETYNGTIARRASYLNWIADSIRMTGMSAVTELGYLVNNFEVRLAYKMSGFTDKKMLKVFAEQASPNSTSDSIIVPDEDYTLHLLKSPPVNRLSYSAVIIERTTTGYRVEGYDLNNPFFNIIPSNANNNYRTITVLNAQGVIYNEYRDTVLSVPYGFEFATRQQVIDFLVSYQRFLSAQGFDFSSRNNDLGEPADWIMSAKEFLFWAQQGWKENSVIVLSPTIDRLGLNTINSVVDEVVNDQFGPRITDINFRILSNTNYLIDRIDNRCNIYVTNGATIGFVELNAVQYEHVVVFENTTVFNDIIYQPELGNRQGRLKLVGFKTDNWAGHLNAPGFILSEDTVEEWQSNKDYRKGDLVKYKNQYYTADSDLVASVDFNFAQWIKVDYTTVKKGLLPNFATKAVQSQDFYDIDKANLESSYDQFSKGIIGFKNRSYLADLGIDDASQVKFYQGMIKAKGTRDSVSALTSATFDTLGSDINFFEEWAIRVGEYGALDSTQAIEVLIDEVRFKSNPSYLEFLDKNEQKNVDRVGFTPRELYKSSNNAGSNIFIDVPSTPVSNFEIEVAGYPRLDDVTHTIFDLSNFAELNNKVDTIGNGSIIWAATGFKDRWDVFRVTSTTVKVVSITNSMNGTLQFKTENHHGLLAGDVILLKNISTFNGFYHIEKIIDINEFYVTAPANLEPTFNIIDEQDGFVLRLESVRFADQTRISDYTPMQGWKDGDLVWVDSYNDAGDWGVYRKDSPWNFNSIVSPSQFGAGDNFGQSIVVGPYSTYAFVGRPNSANGEVLGYVKVQGGSLNQTSALAPTAPGSDGFGATLAGGTNYLIIGAPTSLSATGLVYVALRSIAGDFAITQVLSDPYHANGNMFGSSIALSKDENWLYVGSPGNNSVSVYQFVVETNDVSTITGDGATATFNLTFLPESEYSVNVIAANGRMYVPFIDYTISGSGAITFAPAAIPTNMLDVTIRRIPHYKFITMLLPTLGNSDDQFGYSISTNVDGSIIAVGAPNYAHNAGSAYIFNRIGTAFTSTKLSAVDLTTRFGHSVLVHETDVFVGSPNASGIYLESGKVYHYMDTGGGYAVAQTINNPLPENNELFGSVLSTNASNSILAVGNPYAITYSETTFDNKTTTLDNVSTPITDRVYASGSVCVLDKIENNASSALPRFVFSQQLTNSSITAGDAFGSSIAISDNDIYVGAPNDETMYAATDTGSVFRFTNATGKTGWHLYRYATDLVNCNAINEIYMYNKVSEQRIATLDFIDPVKGKIIGQANQEISYRSKFDPAIYNNGWNTGTTHNVNIDPDYFWGPQQVGQVWWDLTNLRYVHYEQGEFTYRSNNWGRLFPGSTVEVYEWIESQYTPMDYIANKMPGTPKYGDNTLYVSIDTIDKSADTTVTKHYFWVKGLDEAIHNEKRNITISEVARLIEDPRAQGVAYAAIVDAHTVGLYNTASLIEADNTILHIDYDVKPNENVIHSEFALLQEGSEQADIPAKIYNKIIDSLAGSDAVGNQVPDITLLPAERYGISYRPRQSMFKDRLGALRALVEFVNSVFKRELITENYNLAGLRAKDPMPTPASGLWDQKVNTIETLNFIRTITKPVGYKVLVETDFNNDGLWTIYRKTAQNTWELTNIQAYDTSAYWNTVDWYSTEFNTKQIPKFVVNTKNDISKIDTMLPGDLIKVKNNGHNQFEYYLVSSDLSLTLVGLQNGTIQLSTALYNYEKEQTGFANGGFDTARYSQTPELEIRRILVALRDDIFVNNLAIEFNNMIFVLFRFALVEHKSLDWMFKTSFISVLHKIRKLEQYPNYQRDNQNFLIDYINEVKPYRTKIREYLLDYTGEELWDGNVTDFDLPAYYDKDLQLFRSPSGEQPTDDAMYELPEYYEWAKNHYLHLDSILLENAGEGYTLPPVITITGGGGFGATAYAVVANGKIKRIIVDHAGYRYTSTPVITISGGNGVGAKAYPLMTNGQTRKIATTIKFDRYTYNSTVGPWAPFKLYYKGDAFIYNNEVYKARNTYTSGAVFDASLVDVYPDAEFLNAADRVSAFYNPHAGMLGKELPQLMRGLEYPGVQVKGSTFNDSPGFDVNSFDTIGYDAFEIAPDGSITLNESMLDTLIRSSYTDLALGTRAEDINISGGKYVDEYSSHAPEELVPGITFDTLDLQVFTVTGEDVERDGAGPEIFLLSYAASSHRVTYSYNIPGKDNDELFVYTSDHGYQRRDVDYTVDYVNKHIAFTSPLGENDNVFIYVYDNVGNGQVLDETFVGDGLRRTFHVAVPYWQLQQSAILMTVNGVKTTAFEMYPDSVNSKVVFDTPLLETERAHIHVFAGTNPSYSEIHTQFVSAADVIATYTIQTERDVVARGPLSGQVIVEINNKRLRPANNRYYQALAGTAYVIPDTVDVDPLTISPNEIEVYVDGVRKTDGVDYTLLPYIPGNLRQIDFIVAPTQGAEVAVSLVTGSDYRFSGSNTIVLNNATLTLLPTDEIKVVTFANHDPLLLQTQVFIGTQDTVTVTPIGFDQSVFDGVFGWDNETITVIPKPIYPLSRVVSNLNYVWVTLNGTRLIPNYDFSVISNAQLQVAGPGIGIELGPHFDVSVDDVIIITLFTENTQHPTVGYRIFKDMLDNVKYYRIAKENTTVLAQDLLQYDTVMYVQDASVLPIPQPDRAIPGTVSINGEVITYWEIDIEANTITRMYRAAFGTGVPVLHPAGERVTDISRNQLIPATVGNFSEVISYWRLLPGTTDQYYADFKQILDVPNTDVVVTLFNDLLDVEVQQATAFNVVVGDTTYAIDLNDTSEAMSATIALVEASGTLLRQFNHRDIRVIVTGHPGTLRAVVYSAKDKIWLDPMPAQGFDSAGFSGAPGVNDALPFPQLYNPAVNNNGFGNDTVSTVQATNQLGLLASTTQQARFLKERPSWTPAVHATEYLPGEQLVTDDNIVLTDENGIPLITE